MTFYFICDRISSIVHSIPMKAGNFMRKYFIDNIRWMAIMMLFPYHTFMIYNSFGESFYIKGADISATTGFIIATSPWFMPLLFVIAGISSYYALQKRTATQFVKERILKLLIPLIFGLLLLIPAQTYFAERFHNGYTGGYFEQYILFFTKPTDLTGSTGGFTPAHLWFIVYLFIISMVSLPIMIAFQKSKKILSLEKVPFVVILSMFIVVVVMTPILDIAGKSFGEFFAYFILGYLILSNEYVLQKIDKYRFHLLIITLFCVVTTLLSWYFWWNDIFKTPAIANDILTRLYGWTAILTVLGIGRHYLNFRNRATLYMSNSAFPVYLFHQTWLVAVAYYVVLYSRNIPLQMILIIFFSFLLTYVTYEICKCIPVTRFLFGIKARIK